MDNVIEVSYGSQSQPKKTFSDGKKPIKIALRALQSLYQSGMSNHISR